MAFDGSRCNDLMALSVGEGGLAMPAPASKRMDNRPLAHNSIMQ